MATPAAWLLDSPLNVQETLARGLLQIRAVELRPDDPFTWSSGWKAPIYCDNRKILGYPVVRDVVVRGLQSIVAQFYPGTDIVAGAATGGIAHAAMVADRLGLPTAYVRSSAKGHGRQRRVEGRCDAGMSAILIEDTLSTGRSAYDAVEALREEGIHVLAVCAIFSYDFAQAAERAAASGVPAYRLLDYSKLISVATDSGYIEPADVDRLLQWRTSPETYGRS
ncbi:orotate phosphoribosyltransferase [Alicyclobacillus contaminans]|uniref:orotate phosphoribosyltransferase n=1 Tax=Alicyclobacillus contaminans TaxID=392016 RepID=UPI0003F9D5DD|nr:orotate phosphoribosyltransferase [Alicyclobacillus contaminans]GMA49131.1 orotate phosphoribosyltransferase [Alicyclobacillus contaminans]